MSRIHPLLRTPDFLTGDALVSFLGNPANPNTVRSTEWQCVGCGSLLIFDRPSATPDEDCPSCGIASWKRNPA